MMAPSTCSVNDVSPASANVDCTTLIPRDFVYEILQEVLSSSREKLCDLQARERGEGDDTELLAKMRTHLDSKQGMYGSMHMYMYYIYI